MTKVASVHTIKELSQKKEEQELVKLEKSLSLLTWEIATKSILSFCGLGEEVPAWEGETLLPGWSMAGKLGHKTIAEFINKNSTNLDLKWGQWVENSKALSYKNKFGISSDNAWEIIAQYEEVCKLLAFAPSSEKEYHQVKDKVLAEKQLRQEAAHERELFKLSESVSDLEGSLKSEKTVVAAQTQELEILSVRSRHQEEKVNELSADLSDKTVALKNRSEELSSLETESTETIVKISNDLSETQGLLSSTEGALKDSQHKMTEALSNLDSLEKESAETKSYLSKSLKDSKAESSKYKGESESLSINLSDTQQLLAASKSTEENLSSEMKLAKADIIDLTSRLEALSLKNAENESRLATTTIELAEKDEAIKAHTIELLRVEHRMSGILIDRYESPEKLEAIEKELKQVKLQLTKQVGRNRMLVQNFKQTSEKLDATIEKIMEAKEIITAKNKKIRSISEKEVPQAKAGKKEKSPGLMAKIKSFF